MPAKKKPAPKNKKASAKKPAKPHKKVAPHAANAPAPAAIQPAANTPSATVTPGSIVTPLPSAAPPIGAALPSSPAPAPLDAPLPSASPSTPIGAPLPSAIPSVAPLPTTAAAPPPVTPVSAGVPLRPLAAGAPLTSPLPSATASSVAQPAPVAPASASYAQPSAEPGFLQCLLRRLLGSRIVQIGVPVVATIIAFLVIRALPCSINGDYGTWRWWGRIAPNTVCTLDLSNNATRLSAAEIDKRIGSFKNLTALNLANNKLGKVSPAVFALPHLQVLVLDGNRLTAVPPDIGKLWRLSQLSLRGNVIRELPDYLTNMQSIVRLNVASNRLVNVPKSMKNMQNLQSLNIANNAMSGVTLEVRSITQLSQLLLGPTRLPATAQKKIEASMPDTIVVWGDDATAFTGPTWHEPFTAFGSGNTIKVRSAGTVRAAPKATTVVIPAAPPVKKNSTAISSSAKAAAKISPVAAGTLPDCPNGVTVGSYSFCIPDNWTSSVDLSTKAVDLLDSEGNSVAVITCPLQPAEYSQWATTVTSRRYLKKDRMYSADLLAGRAVEDAPDDLLVLLIHAYDLDHWFGDTAEDRKESCMVVSKQPSIDQNVFRTMLSTVY